MLEEFARFKIRQERRVQNQSNFKQLHKGQALAKGRRMLDTGLKVEMTVSSVERRSEKR